MEPPKNKELWRSLLLIALGLVFLVQGLASIQTGHIEFGHLNNSRTYFAAREPVGFWFLVSVFLMLGALLVYRGVMGRSVSRPKAPHKAARAEAVRLGMTVSDVERDMPEFARGNKSCKLVRGFCVRYSLPRHGEGTCSAWSLLQRTEHEGAQLPNGYLLQGEVSDTLRKRLTELATEYSEDYYEFEGTATEVAVYCEEWGGASHIRDLHQLLKSLAGL